MPGWSHLPTDRLLADVSLWSADLANLETAVRRHSPWADSFHLDAANRHARPPSTHVALYRYVLPPNIDPQLR
jgi:hypothetical protein